MMRKLGLICSLAFALLFSSSSVAQDDAPALAFAGLVLSVDQPVRVGAAYDDGALVLFFCGDASNVSTRTHWFKLNGPSKKDGDWQVWLTYARTDGLAGVVSIPGVGLRYWRAPLATGDAGLYRAVNELGTLGVVVTDVEPETGDGVLELQGAVKSADQFSQIVPVSEKIEVVRGELEVNVPVAGGGFSKAIVKRVDVIDF